MDSKKSKKKVGYETSDYKASSVLTIISISLAVIVVIGVLSYYLFLGVRSNFIKSYHKNATMESKELQKVRSISKSKLTGYKWVDKKNGVVQIPIEKAMEKVVEEYRQ